MCFYIKMHNNASSGHVSTGHVGKAGSAPPAPRRLAGLKRAPMRQRRGEGTEREEVKGKGGVKRKRKREALRRGRKIEV